MHSLIGEFAALSAAMLWAFASVLFTTVGKRIGPFNLNAIRMAIGSLLLLVTHYFFVRLVFPKRIKYSVFLSGSERDNRFSYG